MSTSSQSFVFAVNKAPRVYDTNTILNITKEPAEVQYRSYVADDAAAIAYIQGEAIDSDSCLSVFDRSVTLFENREYEEDVVKKVDVSSYLSSTPDVAITDVFAANTTEDDTPLFSRHIISTTNVPRANEDTYDVASGVALLDIKILDVNMDEIGVENLVIDYTYGVVYSNIEHSYDSDTNEYNVYYVQYTVKNGSSIETYTEIYDAQNVYRIATIDDVVIDSMTLNQDGRKVYTIDEESGQFNIGLPVVGTYAFKITTNSRLRLIVPQNSDFGVPWFVKVSNGSFTRNTQGTLYKYYVAEYENQSFEPYSPYKRALGEEALVLSQNLIKTDKQPIFEDDDLDVYVDVLISDSAGTALAAFTTKSTLHGTTASNGASYQYWSNTSRIGIRSVDHRTGIIDIDGFVLYSHYEITVYHTYEEQNYEITSVDFNPVSNPDLLEKRVALFVKPEVFGGDPESRTIYYLKIDEIGKVYESNWEEFSNTYQRMSTSGRELYYEQLPSFKQVTFSGLNTFVHPDSEIFIDRYTVESGVLSTNIFMPLGDVSINRPYGLDQIKTVDVGVVGGGLKDNQVDAAIELNDEVVWYSDIGHWDGVPYPGTSAFYMEVPVEVLSGAGGTFTQNDIKEIAYKYVAAGTYPVIHAYGTNITISGIIPTVDAISFTWDTHSGLLYDIYYSTNEDGPWTRSNSTRLRDNQPYVNSHTVSGLNSDTEYWCSVVAGVQEAGIFYPRSTQFVGPVEDGAGVFSIRNKFKVKTVNLGS